MQVGRPLFSQVMDFVPWTSFDRLVEKYGGDKNAARLRCAVQFRAMAFAQMTFRESLRDIETSLNAHPPKLYGMGFRHPVAKSTLADANEKRDWRMWHDLAVILIRRARKLYAHDDIGLDLDNTVYALDSTTIYEGSGQDAHADRFAWADPQFYPCFQRPIQQRSATARSAVLRKDILHLTARKTGIHNMPKSGGRKGRPRGCSLCSHRLRRLKPLTPTLSPAAHSAMPSMLPCCTSDLNRRQEKSC